ncbi:MAG: 50S ribosomal protein L25 [Anaerolineae bacterium]|nr:50S ribosomal protein L25 [Anaerolineae bacterium]MCB9132025.1 50S ribosomal protein L25 [Anaerolineales bacterium]MCB0231874.1 50S ribosomal protein L25 [Anaerolineae bacterium]MCB0236352.1 50S ribosomal protein L25 [Anaerolineae bacterium]MCB0237663.1 50S ribosomal protein L25 [Anaerolineae bacterium]
MEEYSLQVAMRDANGVKPGKLRAEGFTPAVVYGAEIAPQTVQIESRELDRLLARGGASHLVNLEGEKFAKTRVLIREVQRHPVRREVLHIDFVRVSVGQKIRMAVALHLVGESPAVEEGAILLQNVDSVEIECLPDSLPSFIEVDISGLVHIHDRIHATDLKLPPGVELYGDLSDEALISLSIPRSATTEELEEEEDTGEPEILSDRRDEEDED